MYFTHVLTTLRLTECRVKRARMGEFVLEIYITCVVKICFDVEVFKSCPMDSV